METLLSQLLIVTPLYVAILGTIFFILSLQVVRARRRLQVSLGSGDRIELQRAIRIHGNFAEYIPFLMLLMLILELNGVHVWLLHLYGLMIVIGRLFHWYGLNRDQGEWARALGMRLTLWPLIVGSVLVLVEVWYVVLV